MLILWAIIIGLVLGALYNLITNSHDGADLIVEMLLGIAGSLVGGFVARSFFVSQLLYANVIGAVVLLAVYWLMVSRKTK